MAVTTALIGGGYTLQRLAQRLAPGSFVITSRSAATCAMWRARGWEVFEVDFANAASVSAFFREFPALLVVVDSVPPLQIGPDPALGAKCVAAALSGSAVRQVIYLSTTGVFGVRDGSLVDEATVSAPCNPQAEARLHCEEAYRASAIATCALRLPAIYGPDRGVLHSLRSGTYRMVGSGESWTNRIHVEDLVTVLERAISAESLPPLLCVSDDCPARAREVLEFLCLREGLPMPTSITEQEALGAGAYTLLSSQRVQNALMKRSLAVVLRYPSFREGV